MRQRNMNRNIKSKLQNQNQQAASVLLGSVCNFLLSNGIDQERIARFIEQGVGRSKSQRRTRQFRRILHAYEEMGTVIATWYSEPRFLDGMGKPIPLSVRHGARSIKNLLRISRAKLAISVAIDLMRQSPTIRFEPNGDMVAIDRVFILPGFELLRAGLVIERFLETLQRNASSREKRTTLIFERSCYAAGIKSRKIAPLLRDIRQKGTAFMDSVDGEIESNRIQKSVGADGGEMGVFTFAWTRPPNSKRQQKSMPERRRE
jgi:hypothetical protein